MLFFWHLNYSVHEIMSGSPICAAILVILSAVKEPTSQHNFEVDVMIEFKSNTIHTKVWVYVSFHLALMFHALLPRWNKETQKHVLRLRKIWRHTNCNVYNHIQKPKKLAWLGNESTSILDRWIESKMMK